MVQNFQQTSHQNAFLGRGKSHLKKDLLNHVDKQRGLVMYTQQFLVKTKIIYNNCLQIKMKSKATIQIEAGLLISCN